MTIPIRAIFKQGALYPTETLDLKEGQVVQLQLDILNDDVLRSVLAGVVEWADANYDENNWVDDLADEIDTAFQGKKPLSEIIIEERD